MYQSTYIFYDFVSSQFFGFCFVSGRVTRKEMKVSKFSTLHYVILIIEPVIHSYHFIRTRDISLSSRTTILTTVLLLLFTKGLPRGLDLITYYI